MIFGSLSHTPYTIQEHEGNLIFVTDSGSIYEMYFIDGSSYFPEDTPFAAFTKVFGFKPYQGADRNEFFDPRIGATIAKQLTEYYSDPFSVMMFTCDQSDKKGEIRQRLFNGWYLKHNQFQNPPLEKLEISPGDITITAIFRQDNPLKAYIAESLPELEEKLN